MSTIEKLEHALHESLIEQFNHAKKKGFTDEDNEIFASGVLAGFVMAGDFLAAQDGGISPSQVAGMARGLAEKMGIDIQA